MMKVWRPQSHPVMGLPSPAMAAELGADRFKAVVAQRDAAIAAERADPYHNGWEPPIWKVCDALLGVPWVDPEWAARMRRHLKFEKPVGVLLINGGNRAGKTIYAAKRVMRVLRQRGGARAWAFQSNIRMSIDYQQADMWNFFPHHLKRKIQTDSTYIAYKRQTGFSEGKFILDNLSDCVYRTYGQEEGSVEGANLDIVWPDELVPADLVKTLELRISEKDGVMIITFTPVEGYTETVRMFQDGAEVVHESPAYLCPTDGGPPAVARALGLTDEEFDEIQAAASVRPARAAWAPQSRPEPCGEWLNAAKDAREGHDGRTFEMVPRVLKCTGMGDDIMRAVVFFHSSDNPYGNPKNIYRRIADKPRHHILERFYGVAHKTYSAQFRLFNPKVHCVPFAAIPVTGTNWHIIDPHGSGRNFFMLWIRAASDGNHYVYREWPGNYLIEGEGVPGPWALPDGKLKDGAPGSGQQGFGWGYRRYKEELARLEGWQDYVAGCPHTANSHREEWLDALDPYLGAKEEIHRRLADSRFASTPKMERDRPVTLLTQFADLHVPIEAAPGDDLNEGVKDINDALYFNPLAPIDYFNHPRLYVCEDCRNTVYALQTWTGQDGDKGACKEPIDNLRYYFRAQPSYLAPRLVEDEAEVKYW